MQKELNHQVKSAGHCPFNHLGDCWARPNNWSCVCKPDTGRSFPRRCPLRYRRIIVEKAG